MTVKRKNFSPGLIGFLVGIGILYSAVWSVSRAADTASLLPMPVSQFFDNNGNPLTSGTVTTYDAGTSTLRTTWKDSAEVTPNTNPIRLDAGGKAIIYGSGTYRQVVKDRNGNLIWDAVTAPGGGGSSPTSVGDGNLVGTILPWSGLVAPNQYVFAYGQEISRANFPEYYTAVTQQLNVICSSASNTLTGLSDTTQVKIGSAVELALCVPAGTTVTAKTLSTITLSAPSSVSINAIGTFFPWGNGDGSTTFNVPDLRGIVPIGRDNMGGASANRITTANCGSGITPDALGAFCNSNPGGGHTNTLAELAAHTHTVFDPGHTHLAGGSVLVNVGATSSVRADATTGDQTSSSVTSIAINSSGGGTPFSVVPPSLTINYIAKVTPDTSTSIATGVYSVGGMTGTIACGTGIICTGNIISLNSNIAAGGTTGNVQFNGGSSQLSGSANFNFISPDNLTLGAAGTSFKFDIFGSTSGSVRQVVQAVAGTPTVTWGNSSGTPAVTASSPLAINTTTGDVTCATCFSTSSVNVITNSNLSQTGAATFKGNPTAALANVRDFTVASLTQTISPSALDFIPIYDNATGTIKKINAGSIASSATAGVSSLGGATGAISTTNGGITVSASNLELTAARRTLPTTQSLTSGIAATYTTATNALWIEVYACGGGGGGMGVTNAGAGSGVAGSTGGTTTFNSVNAIGGGGAPSTGAGGIGGTGGTGTATRRAVGGPGGSALLPNTTLGPPGGNGGDSYCGGGAVGPVAGAFNNGNSAASNSGAGGSGGVGSGTNFVSGGGGGSGEFFYLLINNPAATYTYTIGNSGAGGAGVNETGGNGGNGFIFVIEHYGT